VQAKAELEQRLAASEQQLRAARDGEVEQEGVQRRLCTQLADAGSETDRLQAELKASSAAAEEAAAEGRRLGAELQSVRSDLEDLQRRMEALNARLAGDSSPPPFPCQDRLP
jgi:chromosome segregation ATPase